MITNWDKLPLGKEYINLTCLVVDRAVRNVGGSNLLIPLQVNGREVVVYDPLSKRFYNFQADKLYYHDDLEKTLLSFKDFPKTRDDHERLVLT